ncbi:NAD-dependent epimerase/dehydratase family protein [Limoniibacter endophyticus]|uniref:Nucleoside-diphosphate sugar epimerase n=1 Tax=Limoniibacter endophyticus TaxID=1565040 RepID=A0A8J3DRY2_9HYPH|nr:NAD(P)-dependent oxidoreductase [Limoniibacter endophyticus]GHC76486.1 nucleoside-diphosphate sugar epimerase [Limoniibacter endophyticus]
MAILVTGSSGRVGSSVVKALLARGKIVHGFDARASRHASANYSETVGSFDDPQRCAAAVDGASAILHLGAFMSWKPEDRDLLFAANVEGTRRLLEAASEAGVQRFVFASSGEVYPENLPAFLPVTESHPLNPTSPYGLTKLLGEELVQFHGRTGKMEIVILRFSHTQDAKELLDPDSFFSGPRFFLRPRIRQQEALGNHAVAAVLRAADPGQEAHVLVRNENSRPYRMHITDTRDMVQGILLALEKPEAAGEVFNLGATEPVDFVELLRDMAEVTGLPVVSVDLPGAGVCYETSNEKIRHVLGFEPEWTIKRMLNDAAMAWRERAA